MSDTKHFDPAALASIADGRLMCDFSVMHEAIEHVLGRPVWTHELADHDLAEEARRQVIAQFPDMAQRTETPWQEVRDAVRARYGDSVPVKRGHCVMTEHPRTSLVRMFSRAEEKDQAR